LTCFYIKRLTLSHRALNNVILSIMIYQNNGDLIFKTLLLL
jgi:hypothetical protein